VAEALTKVLAKVKLTSLRSTSKPHGEVLAKVK
jgi:hypothetical protein